MDSKKSGKTSTVHLLIGIGVGLLMISFSFFEVTFYKVAESKTYDQWFILRSKFFGPIPMDPNLALVDLDDATLTYEGRWQDWTRDKHTKIIRVLKDFGAAMLGFDVFFVEPSTKGVSQERLEQLQTFDRESVLRQVRDYDGEMEQAIREAGNVYLGQFLEALEEGDRVSVREPNQQERLDALKARGFCIPYPNASKSTIKRVKEASMPLKSLIEAAKGVGFAEAFPDADGTRRRFPLFLLYEDQLMPSLALVMLCDYLQVPLSRIQVQEGKALRIPGARPPDGPTRDIEVPIDGKGQMLVNWAGEFNPTFVHYPHVAISLLAQDKKALEALRVVKRIGAQHPEAVQDPARLMAMAREQGVDDAGLVSGFQASLQAASLMEQAVTADPGARTADVFAQLFGIPKEQVPPGLGPDAPKETLAKVAPSEDYIGQIRDLLTTLDDVRINNLVVQKMAQARTATDEEIANGVPGVPPARVRRSLETLRHFLADSRVQEADRPLYFPPLKPITYVNKGISQTVTATSMKGKVFFYGLTATATHDLNPTPYEPAYSMVGIYPNVFNTILNGLYLREMSHAVDYMAILILGFVVGMVASRMKALNGALLILVLLLLYLLAAFVMFAKGGFWIEVVGPVGTMTIGFLSITIYNYVQKEKEKDFVQGAFGHFLDPKVVENLVEHPELVEQLGGEERMMTAFFSDLASFSGISENLSPTDLVGLLNRYLTDMCDIIQHHGGTIDKFEGDKIIAFYGAPISYEDHANRAVLACIDQQEKLVELRKGFAERGEMAPLRKKWEDEKRGEFLWARMGVNTGRMVVGNMGSKTRVDYTIMGDAVNLASRLEEAGKQYGVCTMVGQDTYEQAKDAIEVRLLDAIRVVGKEQPVRVYEILGRKGKVEPARAEAAALYSAGFQLYTAQRWDEAIASFRSALRVNPADGPSPIFIKRCETYKQTPPPADWDGVNVLVSK